MPTGTLAGVTAAIADGIGPLGAGIADAFARAGARVEVGGGDGRAIEDLLDRAVARFGALDVVVLAAASDMAATPLAEMSDDAWDQAVARRMETVFWGMRRALHHMLPRGRGRILVTSTVDGKLPRPGAAGAVAAEHGIAGLVKSVAHEVGPQGVTVNAILAGPLELVDGAGHLGRSLTGRPTSVQDVAAAAVLLAAPSMTSISGYQFPVDGGATPY